MKHLPKSLWILLAAALLVACGETAPETAADDAAPQASATGEAAVPASEPAPEASVSTPAGGQTIAAPGAEFTLPEGWVAEEPASAMRLAQARIPGDAGPAELTVFYFGPGGGGGLEANLGRWIGQVDGADEPTRESFTLGDWQVTWIDVTGTLKPSTMGTGPTEPQPDSRLLGAVVEGEGGPWFFKATGPAATLEAQRDAFLALLKSGRPAS